MIIIYKKYSINPETTTKEKQTEVEKVEWKKKTIRNYHLESDIFHQKPTNQNEKKETKNYYKSDIFNLKEDKDNNENKQVRKGKRRNIEINKKSEKEKKPNKKYNPQIFNQTFEKEWNTKRIKPEKRKEDPDNPLAYDLTKEPPKVERTHKKMIKDHNPKKSVKQGKKLLKDPNKEDPRNTLAFH